MTKDAKTMKGETKGEWEHQSGHKKKVRIHTKRRSLRPVALLALSLFFLPSILLALDFRIQVVDPATGKPVSDAQVIILETRTRIFTDEKGLAAASVPSPGYYTFRAILPDGRLVQPRLQVLSPGQTVQLLASGEPPKTAGPTEVGSGGIVVTGQRDRTKLSRYQVRLDEVKRLPGQFGEAMRGLETLPGVSPIPFGTGEIIIRGANPNSNVYLFDDLPMGYAFHLGAFNQVIHNDIIRSMDVYTGAYPANFGNATGGVIYIDSVDDVKKFGGHVNYSLWSTSSLFQGTFADGKGYWIGAGRVSYLHILLKPYIPEGIRPPRYWDGQFKMKYSINQHHTIYFYALGAKDLVGATVSKKPSWDPTAEPDPIYIGASIAFDEAFHTEAVRHVWQPGSQARNELTLYYHDNIHYVDGRIGSYSVIQGMHNGWGSLKDDFDWEIWRDHAVVEAGGEIRNLQYRMNGQQLRQLDPNNPNPDPYDTVHPAYEQVDVHDSKNTMYNSGYGMITLKGGGLEFKPGFRTEYFGLTKQMVTDPRGSLSYTFPTKTMLIAGAGVYHRLPDPWQYSPSSGNPDLKMERAEHYGLGIQQEIENWTMKVEGFRHFFTDIVVADPYITTPARANQSTKGFERYQTPYIYNDRLGWSNDGTGYSEGAELYIKRSLPQGKNGLYGWFTYTWSKSIRNNHQHIITDQEKNTVYSADERRVVDQYDNTKDVYADFDRTVIVNVILGYKWNREWQIGTRWNYRTSQPYTPITGDDGGTITNSGRPIFNPKYSDLTNSARLKPYHRLDIRIDHFFNYEWGFANVYFEALNLYLRDNESGMSWTHSRPYSATNPSVSYDFASLEIPMKDGETIKTPLFNLGIEVKF